MSTVSGLVMAMYGKLFFNPLPSYWTKEHTKACIAMTKKHYSSFMVEEKERKAQQDLARAKVLREKELKAEDKLVRNSLNQISYFTIPTLRTMRSPKQLEAAIGTLRSMTKKLDFSKLFISMYAIGFGFDIPLKFSNSKNKEVGTYDDLIARAKHILTQKHTIPDIPPLQKGCQSTPSEFGLTLVNEWTTSCEKYQAKAEDQIVKVLDLDTKYGVKLLYDWDSIQRQYWDVPLTELQEEFRRDRGFVTTAKNIKLLGYLGILRDTITQLTTIITTVTSLLLVLMIPLNVLSILFLLLYLIYTTGSTNGKLSG
jgi:hypothetical protein